MAQRRVNREGGQALLLLVGALAAVLVGAFVLGAIARGVGKQGADQRAADLGALAGARAMRTVYYRLFEPAAIAGRRNPRHLERSEYLRLGRAAARVTAARNGARDVGVEFPDGDEIAPVRIRVTVSDPAVVTAGGHREEAAIRARAEAELAPPGGGWRRSPAVAATADRSPIARASRCAPTWRSPSTAWRPPPCATASR